jgi:prepilin-type N-terminal cleavage/methylation domain-containing protein
VRPRGLTLLETLVALAITALLLGALGGAVRRAADARTRTTAAADRAALTRTLLFRLATEIEAARVPAPTDAAGFERFVVESTGSWSAIRLATVATVPLAATTPTSDVHAVGYRIEADPARPGTAVLVRRDALPGADEPPGDPVLAGVRSFHIRCFDGDTWLPQWPSGSLPRAVEVTLGVDDGLGGTDERAVTVALPSSG